MVPPVEVRHGSPAEASHPPPPSHVPPNGRMGWGWGPASSPPSIDTFPSSYRLLPVLGIDGYPLGSRWGKRTSRSPSPLWTRFVQVHHRGVSSLPIVRLPLPPPKG